MSITTLSTELMQKIYESCDLVDALHLSQTSKRNYNVLRGRHLHILGRALDNSFGPVPSLVKLVISNESEKKTRRPVGTEIRRNVLVDRIIQTPDDPPLSIELMAKMVKFGQVASRWVEIFPQFRWRADYKNRRFLRGHEQQRLRRAIYHYWTYNNLFHDDIYTQFNPVIPSSDNPTDPRLRLVRTYSTIELVQLSEFLNQLVSLIENDLYPSNSIVQASHNFTPKAVAKIAWGNGYDYVMLVQDLLKYTPSDFLYLFERTCTKSERMEYLEGQGHAFQDTPATLEHAIFFISKERHSFSSSFSAVWKDLCSSPTSRLYGRFVKQEENVKFGIADYEGEGPYPEDHPYNNDASMTGVWKE